MPGVDRDPAWALVGHILRSKQAGPHLKVSLLWHVHRGHSVSAWVTSLVSWKRQTGASGKTLFKPRICKSVFLTSFQERGLSRCCLSSFSLCFSHSPWYFLSDEGGYLCLTFRRKIVLLLKPLMRVHDGFAWYEDYESQARGRKSRKLGDHLMPDCSQPEAHYHYPLIFDVPLSNKRYVTLLPFKSGIFWVTIGI